MIVHIFKHNISCLDLIYKEMKLGITFALNSLKYHVLVTFLFDWPLFILLCALFSLE